MSLKPILYTLLLATLLLRPLPAAANTVNKDDPEYQALRETMSNAFNTGDSLHFFRAVKDLQKFLLTHDDLHGYYTQRCNEIVFLLNRQCIFEAYKLSLKLSRELRERKLDSELYLAINMMGHVYNYCGNRQMARQCFHEVLERMEREGYYESMPPIYMNLVHLEDDEHPEEALRLMDRAAQIADSVGRNRRDIDVYRAIFAFKNGDMKTFEKGYRQYEEMLQQGHTSVHGARLEAYQMLAQGDVKGAIAKATEKQSAVESHSTQAFIYQYVGDWKRAYEALQRQVAASDSVNSVILMGSMEGIQNELELYEAERDAEHQRVLTLLAITACLLVIVAALFIYSYTRRRHIKELKTARDRALESDRMKTAFISNISHELRTPLNIISGFTQVLSDESMTLGTDERHSITGMMTHNANLITQLVDELIDLSITDSTAEPETGDVVDCNELCREVIEANQENKPEAVRLILQSQVADGYQLLTNRGALRKILNALVDNALKYTEQGDVRITVGLLPSAVAFAVEDTGCGIPASEGARIFERFEKLDSFKSGLGLGLPLARRLAERLGGTLQLDTSYSAGARFVVSIPLP